MEVLAEQVTTVRLIGSGIENMSVPEFINRSCGTDLPICIHDIER
jgi:hypothetical protein